MAEPFGRRAPSRWGEGAALKEEMPAAAARLPAEPGRPRALSLRAAVRETGICAPGPCPHVEDRSEPVATVTRRACGKRVTQPRATRARAAVHGPREALRAKGRRYCAFALENPGATG
ncbi:hypothetical protein FRZ03_00885 [Streptomyces misionensis]|uniref:Uncharacterized protein n=1 Tax=Streptomyces misionensis TaxID=67331 RepID=A0A5C6K6T7_9ACTN|nr:hypothetical protein [Streptomyces misionensis]TWV58279.1 hypothetical protein FRZ03_00885 [Streptomyces misionensis]